MADTAHEVPVDEVHHHGPGRLLAVTLAAVFGTELVIMVVLSSLPPLEPWVEALVDASVLSLLVFPVLYVTTFRPVLREVEERRRAERALQDAYGELDARVRARTAELADANEALRRERNFVDAVVETAGALVVVLDPEGRIVRFNRACERTSGYSFEEVRGRDLFPLLVPPEELDAVTATFRRLTAGDLPSELENHWVTRDGALRFITWSNTAIAAADGTTDFVIGTGLDVTESKANERLIRASLQEKEVLLKEIHHRVKNNLQIIASLLNLQVGRLTDEHVVGPLLESQNRIRTMALIHEKVYRSPDLARIPFKDYVRDLAGSLLDSFGPREPALTVDVDVDDLALGLDTAIPVALIVNELVSNSVKHAFDRGSAGRISISLRRHPAGRFSLVVADDGRGVPASLDLRRTSSLGFELVNVLATQLGGSVAVTNDGGARVEVSFDNG